MTRLILATMAAIGLLVTSPSWAQRSQSCEPTIWDLVNTTYDEEGTAQSQAGQLIRSCLFEGDLQMDEFRLFSEEGRAEFWGASFYQSGTMGPATNALWIMVGDPGISELHNVLLSEQVGNTQGTGTDVRGEFLERSVTVHHENSDYDFYLARSYDNGENWLSPTNIIRGQFVSHDVPEPPSGLVPVMREGADATGVDLAGAIFVLDGAALIRTFERDGSKVIVFASRYWEPNRWREVEWVVETNEIIVTETPF